MPDDESTTAREGYGNNDVAASTRVYDAGTSRMLKMADTRPVRTEADYEAALARIDEIMDTDPDSPDARELDVLVDLVELYESQHEPMGHPDPVSAIEFRMEQAGLKPRDLIPFIGSRTKVAEILSGKRPITMPMARALHEHLGIPTGVLLRQSGKQRAVPVAR